MPATVPYGRITQKAPAVRSSPWQATSPCTG